MTDCLFCKIAEGKIPAKLVHQDHDTVAFQDINPQAPLHVLVIPKVHIPTMNDLTAEHDAVMGKLYRVAANLAKEKGYAASGWRATMNANRDAGQTVFHVHLHVLGGRPFTWPPG
jgi:histidine triad (HIT) family protein